MIALARAGHIRAHIERFALADVRAAYDKLRAGDINGQAVVMPAA